MNNGDITRIMNDCYTVPDVTFISNNINYDDVDWWVKDYERGKFASDHLTILTFIHDIRIYGDRKLEYCIRNGENLDWNKWKDKIIENEILWQDKYGKKLSKFINLYISNLDDNNDNFDVDNLKKEIGIDNEFIINSVKDLMDDVIIKAAKDVFGIRIKNKFQSKPWMTADIKNAIDDYMRFKKKFYSFSKRKKKNI